MRGKGSYATQDLISGRSNRHPFMGSLPIPFSIRCRTLTCLMYEVMRNTKHSFTTPSGSADHTFTEVSRRNFKQENGMSRTPLNHLPEARY